MKIKIVGIREISYTSKKTNQPVVGREIHFVNLSEKRNDLSGYVVGSQFMRSDSAAYGVPVEVGKEYTMYKDGYRVEYLGPVKE